MKYGVEKMKIALLNGYSVIRIYQTDVYYEKINWKSIIEENRKNDKLKCLFFANNPTMYDSHKKLLISEISAHKNKLNQ